MRNRPSAVLEGVRQCSHHLRCWGHRGPAQDLRAGHRDVSLSPEHLRNAHGAEPKVLPEQDRSAS